MVCIFCLRNHIHFGKWAHILGLLVKGIVFGLFMSLLFGKTVFKKENKENED